MIPACYYGNLHLSQQYARSQAQAELQSPLQERVIEVQGESRALSITKVAIAYIGCFLFVAAIGVGVVAALVVTHQALPIILGVGIFFALIPTFTLAGRAISYFSTRKIRKEVVDAQLKHLKTTFDIALQDRAFRIAQEGERTAKDMTLESVQTEILGVEGISEIQAKEFANKVIQLMHEVQDLTEEGADVSLDSVERLYRKFQALAENPLFKEVYNKIKANENLECVNFLKILSIKFRTAFVGEVMRAYAQKRLPKIKECTPAGMADVVHRHHGEWFSFKRSKWYHWPLWILGYPDRCVSAQLSNDAPKLYDAMEDNNATCFMKTECHGVPIFLSAQPTLGADPVFDLIGSDASHQILLNRLDTRKDHEYRWIQKLDQKAKEYKGKTKHLVSGFSSKKESHLMRCEGTHKLLGDYQKIVTQEGRELKPNGVGTYVSREDLSDEEVDQVFVEMKELVQDEPDLSESKKLATLAIADGLMAFKVTTKKAREMSTLQTEGADETMRGLTVSDGCKQCQDRGPLGLAIQMILWRGYTSDKPLTPEECSQIMSVVLRAPINEGRLQLRKHAKVLEEILKLFGSDMRTIHEITHRLDKGIAHQPSAIQHIADLHEAGRRSQTEVAIS